MTDYPTALAAAREVITAERLRKLLDYDAETGEFRLSTGRALQTVKHPLIG